MHKSRLSKEQIAAIVRGAGIGGLTAKVVAKKYGIAETTLFGWNRKFGEMDASQAAEMEQLRSGSARLKRLVAQQALRLEV